MIKNLYYLIYADKRKKINCNLSAQVTILDGIQEKTEEHVVKR